MDSNPGPLVLESTALPTMQPPPLPILKHKFTLSFSCATQIIFFLKSGTIPASFVYFHSFLIAISIIQIEESVDGALGN